MWIQFDSDWRVRAFYIVFFGSVFACNKSFSVSYSGGCIGHYYLSYPYMIRFSSRLPICRYAFAGTVAEILLHYASGSQTVNHESLWKKLIFALLRITVVYSIVSVAVIAIAFRFLVPFSRETCLGFGNLYCLLWSLFCLFLLFLRAIMIKKNHSVEFVTLWRDSRGNRAPLVATIVL